MKTIKEQLEVLNNNIKNKLLNREYEIKQVNRYSVFISVGGICIRVWTANGARGIAFCEFSILDIPDIPCFCSNFQFSEEDKEKIFNDLDNYTCKTARRLEIETTIKELKNELENL